ncbi:MAG: glycosyltransferase [Candidatus Omnitrophica bacterium]|nr:glycosyltransferase [Candidatus Omnitrophota bacterium]
MKIAFFVYPSAFQSPGGGEILLLKTKEVLESKGISVKLFNQWDDSLKEFDILHVFGSVKECLGLMQTAKALGVKIVLSPVFWSTLQRALHEYGGIYKKSKMALQHIVKVICPVMPSARRKMHLLADILVPNSNEEAKQISRLFQIDRKKMRIVYLGVDERFAHAEKNEFVNKYGLEDFILSVGRIEPRKNQLNLIKAVKGLDKKLVLIGDPVSGYEEYYKKCKEAAGDNVVFIGHIDHNSNFLSSAYAACSVFALQGWFETPGLAALEAGLAGARLAVTQGGSTREYFKDYVEYLDPANPQSIREAIDKALERPKNIVLKEYIMENFLWHHVAEENIKVYKEILR